MKPTGFTPVPLLKGFKVHDMPKVEKALTEVPRVSLPGRNLHDRTRLFSRTYCVSVVLGTDCPGDSRISFSEPSLCFPLLGVFKT